jgi:pyrimidine deaminase RibD-like protein
VFAKDLAVGFKPLIHGEPCRHAIKSDPCTESIRHWTP